VRIIVAVALLLLSTVVVLAALLSGTEWAISTAAVVTALAGWASVRILVNEIAQTRREAARDRAEQAQAYRRIFTQRVAEHDTFAATMTERIAARESEIRDLRGTVRVADTNAAQAQARVRVESKRTVALQARLDELTRELEEERGDADSLAFWGGGDASTVVDLLAWEERANPVSEVDSNARKQA